MALRVINDIVSFQEELEAQAYNEVHFGFNLICVEGYEEHPFLNLYSIGDTDIILCVDWYLCVAIAEYCENFTS